jgi:hypothetical protein
MKKPNVVAGMLKTTSRRPLPGPTRKNQCQSTVDIFNAVLPAREISDYSQLRSEVSTVRAKALGLLSQTSAATASFKKPHIRAEWCPRVLQGVLGEAASGYHSLLFGSKVQ